MNPTSLSILKQYWGYDQFRPLQEEIIHAVLMQEDTLALMRRVAANRFVFKCLPCFKKGYVS
ncbi:hypothetical protein [Sphingobacterium populi]|uniref:hypothetical protein n=1 Tax=Sphingobacterium sp. CFCC 11742 TaxID=1775560 RepID=UPI000ABDBACB|nr:hypothetical protein [Sphingobacterium sp. CFCC 11742]